MNIAKFLRTVFLKNTSGGSFCDFQMKVYRITGQTVEYRNSASNQANQLITLKKHHSISRGLGEMRVLTQQQLGRLFRKVEFSKCKIHAIHRIRQPR